MPYGASVEEFQAALADMEPVTLVIQSTAAKGAPTGRRFEAYAEAVEEWSGGKISTEIAYSNAIAEPTDVDNALADGRLDVGSVVFTYTPENYPALNGFYDIAFVGSHSAVGGYLEFTGASLDIAWNSEQITEEFRSRDLQPLMPIFTAGTTGMICREPHGDLATMRGAVVGVTSRAHTAQATGLGASPTSLAFTETYEALDRGTVDCYFNSLTQANFADLFTVAPNFTIDDQVGIARNGGALAMSAETWDDLPLAAQQLLFDRVDVMLEANISSSWTNYEESLTTLRQAGGQVTAFDGEMRARLQEINDGLLEAARQSDAFGDGDAFVDSVLATVDRWDGLIAGLGYGEVDYNEFAEWYAANPVDLGPFLDLIWSEVMLEHRPGGQT